MKGGTLNKNREAYKLNQRTHVFDGGVSANAGIVAQRLSVRSAVDFKKGENERT